MATIKRDQPFVLDVEHDQQDTTSYELRDGSGAVIQTATPDPAGVQFRFPQGLPIGSHTFTAVAIGADGSEPSDPLTLEAEPRIPSKPVLRLRIVADVTVEVQ